jgi:hypothetical protein
MTPPRTLLIGVLGLLLATVLAVAALARRPVQGPVYSVAQVEAQLARAPERWVGRTVRVSGVAWPCLGWAYRPCLIHVPLLADADARVGLALARQTAHPLLAVVQALPLVGRLVPPEQAPRWGVLASYRVQIRAVPRAACTYWPCYEALLLDTRP